MKQEGSINPADRYVIINADDFGISLSTNQAIDDMFQSDAITSTSIMMPAPAAYDAASRCRQNKSMQVGIHLTLTSDRAGGYKPVYTKTQLTSITTDQGFFYTDAADLERKADPGEVRLELEAQIELAIALGIEPTHLDSHAGSVLGLFQLRDFLEVVFDLCEKYALPFCLPTGILQHPGFTDEMKQLFKQRMASAGRRGIRLIDDMAGVAYHLSEGENYDRIKKELLHQLDSLKPGITQIVTHPSLRSDDPNAWAGHQAKREMEYRLYNDPEIKKRMNDLKLKRISWQAIRDWQRSGAPGAAFR